MAADDIDADLENELSVETVPVTNENASEPIIEPMPVADGDVIIEKAEDRSLPYKERRDWYGILFSVNYENFYPRDYFSVIQNEYYDIFLDKNIPLASVEFGLKYNFSVGSVAALVGYSFGSIADEDIGIKNISAAITKADLNISLDGLFSEPYVVPFAQAGVHVIDWHEESTPLSGVSRSENFRSQPNYHYKAGLSFQLNWIERAIDPGSADDSLRSGLENTYLDVFYAHYARPSKVSVAEGQEGEGDLQSSEYGMGLKLEF